LASNEEGEVRIQSMQKGGLLENSHLKPGDRILFVNQTPCHQASVQGVASLIQAASTHVTIVTPKQVQPSETTQTPSALRRRPGFISATWDWEWP